MQEAVQHFVEKMGLLCEKEGMARSAGRILGLLLASGATFSLDEIADRIQASKASVSTNARMLEQAGMIERVSVLGDRRDFYRVEEDPWEKMLRVAMGRWRDMIQVFAEAQEGIPCEEGRRKLREAERFHRLLLTESEKLVENWRRLRAEEDAATLAASDAA